MRKLGKLCFELPKSAQRLETHAKDATKIKTQINARIPNSRLAKRNETKKRRSLFGFQLRCKLELQSNSIYFGANLRRFEWRAINARRNQSLLAQVCTKRSSLPFFIACCFLAQFDAIQAQFGAIQTQFRRNSAICEQVCTCFAGTRSLLSAALLRRWRFN